MPVMTFDERQNVILDYQCNILLPFNPTTSTSKFQNFDHMLFM